MMTPFTGMDLASLLDERARRHGGRPFIVWAPFDAPAETWTYDRFAGTVARLAGGLAARGVGPGDRVMVHLENCPETLIARFACARLGAVCVSTNALAAGPELEYYAGFTNAVGAITQPKLASLVAAHCGQLRWIAVTSTDSGAEPAPGTVPAEHDRFSALLGERLPARAPDASQPASIMFTTGTTSRPKGVVWTQANALWGGRLGALQQALRPDDVYQVFLPLFHVVGLSWSFLPALWAGACVVLQPRFSASRYWDAALAHGTTVGSQVIYTTRMLASQPVPPDHRIRQWTDALCVAEYESLFRLRMVGGWGMTEMVAQGIVGDPWSPQRPGSIGRPSAGYAVQIRDDDDRPISPGDTGHLFVKGVPGVSIFAEYFQDPQATKEAFDADGWFRTGDRVTLHEDGWIQFADRAKDVIKVGGEGVSAAEIESAVRAVPGVAEVAVVARPDADYGEVAVAFVVASSDAKPDIGDAVISHCRTRLAKFKVPREVILIDMLPKVGFGKISKAVLRERLKKMPT